MPTIRGVIFDMDGLVADTEILHMKAHQRFLDRYDIHLHHIAFMPLIGLPTRDNIAGFKARYGLPGSAEQLYDERDDILIDIYTHDPMEPLPGFIEVLADLRQRGLALAVASSSSHRQIEAIMPRMLERLPDKPTMDEVFCAVTSGDEVPGNKPEPDIYLETCRRMNLEPEQVLAFEDSQHGITAATRAGCLCIGVPQPEYSAGFTFDHATHVATSLKEVLEEGYYGVLEED